MENGGKVKQYPNMATGDGERSYARNSRPQGNFVKNMLPHVHAHIDRMELPRDGTIVLADLGCGSGPNAIASMEAVIKHIQEKHEEQRSLDDLDRASPNFLAYFQDVPTNDFNTLFRYLAKSDEVDAGVGLDPNPKYFAAGVPGSFYSTLFPPSSVHVSFSSWAMHWLSKIPASILDPNSPANNRGNITFCRSSPATIQAYAKQSDQDLRDFLAARAKELVPGGLLVFTFIVRFESDPSCFKSCRVSYYQEEIMDQLVSEGVVEAEVRDSFNQWEYFRSEQEVKEILESFSSVFEVQTQQLLSMPWEPLANDDPRVLAQNVERHVRAFEDVLMQPHFGPEAMDLFWRRFQDTVCERNTHKNYLAELPYPLGVIFYILRKK